MLFLAVVLNKVMILVDVVVLVLSSSAVVVKAELRLGGLKLLFI